MSQFGKVNNGSPYPEHLVADSRRDSYNGSGTSPGSYLNGKLIYSQCRVTETNRAIG